MAFKFLIYIIKLPPNFIEIDSEVLAMPKWSQTPYKGLKDLFAYLFVRKIQIILFSIKLKAFEISK